MAVQSSATSMLTSRSFGLALISCLLAGCQIHGPGLHECVEPRGQPYGRAYRLCARRARLGWISIHRRIPMSSRVLPLIVFWYGVPWQSGNRNDFRFVGAALAARSS